MPHYVAFIRFDSADDLDEVHKRLTAEAFQRMLNAQDPSVGVERVTVVEDVFRDPGPEVPCIEMGFAGTIPPD